MSGENVYPPNRLVGLFAHTERQRHATVAKLQVAIDSVKAKGQPVGARMIYEESGLHYASYARNPEARALFQAQSSHLAKQRKQRGRRQGRTVPHGQIEETVKRDPLLQLSKPRLVARLRKEQQQRVVLEHQYAVLLEQQTRHDLESARWEAERERYRGLMRRMGLDIVPLQ